MEPQDPNQEMEITLIRRTRTLVEDPAAGQRKRDRESGRQQAQQDAPEMLKLMVQIARNDAEDTKNRFMAAKYVCDRAWGTPKAEQAEDPALTNKTILDILEQVSLSHAQVEQQQRQKAIEAPPATVVHPAAQMDLTSDYELIEDATDGRTDGV